MKRLALIAGLVLGAVAFAGRPGTEYQLLINLNGEEVRWTMGDGGQSGLFGTGRVCMPVSELPAGANSTIEVMPTVPINLCERSTTAVPRWDGGCNGVTGDPNYGVQLQAFVPKFATLRSSTTHLCAVSDAGVVIAPVFSLQ